MMKLKGKARKVVLSAKTPMLIQLGNDLIWERTRLVVAKAEKSDRGIAFHECRIASLEKFIALIKSLDDATFKKFVKEHGKEIF